MCVCVLRLFWRSKCWLFCSIRYLVVFLLVFLIFHPHLEKNSTEWVTDRSESTVNAQWSNQCRGLIELTAITVSLLQGERQDSDAVEERNAQVQLEKAKVLSRSFISRPDTPAAALARSFSSEAARKDVITSRHIGLAEQYPAIKISHCSLLPCYPFMCSMSGEW